MLYQDGWARSGPRGGDWIPGNSRRCSAQYKFPRRWRRLDLYQQQQGALIPMGLRHLYQGSVGDGKHWITVIQGSHEVIDLNFVYTLSLLITVYTLFQDPFWGVSDFPVSYHGYLYFSFFSMWILICWCEENTGRHFKGFYLSKILRHEKQ